MQRAFAPKTERSRRRFSRPTIAAVFCAFVALAGAAGRAEAIPYFAHEYGLVCQKCHSVIPRLNEFGTAFLEHGYALRGTAPQSAFPLATKVNFAYTSEPDPSGLPEASVDEVELFLARPIGSRLNYFIEQYVVDGGRPGSTREAWLRYRTTPGDARIPLDVTAGSMTLPLPVDPESFRESNAHYAIFDQTVGDDPFTFFEPKIGLQAHIGRDERGTSFRLLALQGHDKQSGIATVGIDSMAVAREAVGPLALSLYRYDGRRPDRVTADRFWRQGYGLTYGRGRWEADAIVQTGGDSSFDGLGSAAVSSGGFAQVRYEFNRRLFGSLRYDATDDTANGHARGFVPLVGFRLAHNARLTIEDQYRWAPHTKHTLNAQVTAAY